MVTLKKRAFALEYCLDFSKTQAAIRAGYSKKAAHTTGNKLYKEPEVRALIDELLRRSREDFDLQRQEIVWRLWAHMTRDVTEFLDENGRIDAARLKHDIPKRELACVEGIEQDILRRYTEDDGTVVEVVRTKLHLTSLSSARTDAMKYKGLFELDNKTETRVVIDLDQLTNNQRHTIESDPIEARLRLEEKK